MNERFDKWARRASWTVIVFTVIYIGAHVIAAHIAGRL